MSTLKQKLQIQEAKNKAKRLEIEAKKLEIEAKKLEIQISQNQKPNTILRLTINEWTDAIDAGGGFLSNCCSNSTNCSRNQPTRS